MNREIKLGSIVYYGPLGNICKGIFCGHPLDEAFSIVFPLYPDRLVLDAKSDRGDSTIPHEFFACTLERNEDIFLDPQELIDHETAEIRDRMKKELENMNKNKKRASATT